MQKNEPAATYTQFEGLYCECCGADETQQLRCGPMTAWENVCRSCWNNHLVNVTAWEEELV